jgi:hypothetical protein
VASKGGSQVQERSPRLTISSRRLPEPAWLGLGRGKSGATPAVAGCVRPCRPSERRDRAVVAWRPVFAAQSRVPRSVVSFPNRARSLPVVLPRRTGWGHGAGPASPRSILAATLSRASRRAALPPLLAQRGEGEAMRSEDSWRSLRELVGAVLAELRPALDREGPRQEGRYNG